MAIPFAKMFARLRPDVLRVTLPRMIAMVLIAIAVVPYIPFLQNPLVFDDFNVINGVSFLDYAFQFWIAPRWLAYATLAHTYAITEGSLIAMRLGNVLLHACNVVTVFVLLREILMAADGAAGDNQSRKAQALLVASVGAAVFAVHPVAVYGVGYLVQRTILMSTFFMLLMLVAYVRWLSTGRTALWVWSALWYLLSVFSKEHAIAAPAVALLLTLVLYRPNAALARRMIAPFAVYLVIAIVVVSMIKGVLGKSYEPYALDMIKDLQEHGDVPFSYPLSLLTQLFLYFKYMFLWMFPNVNWMSVDMREPLATSLFEWPYWGAAAAFLAYAIVVIAMIRRAGRMGVAGWDTGLPVVDVCH
jgi:protein O-mannosyl-transferase